MPRIAHTLVLFALVAACDRPGPSAGPTPSGATASAAKASKPEMTEPASLHALSARRLDGTEEPLGAYAGKVLLVVNTASECGYTPQYEALQALHAKYASRGFSVLGFPSNDFGGQEPGSSTEIATFCKTRYGVAFPLFEKVKTKGEGQSPIYSLLGSAKGAPKWNFHKYLVDKAGKPIAAWPSAVRPDAPEITQAIEAELASR